MFGNYDPPSKSTDVAGEVAAGQASPIEIANFYSQLVEPGGVTISDPTWTLDDLLPLIEADWTTTVTVGSMYDYMPDTLSKVLYDTHDLWFLLMALNGAGTRADFTGPTFTIVRQSACNNLQAALKLAQSKAAIPNAAGALPSYKDLTVRPVPVFVQPVLAGAGDS